ncbi:Hypothetical protein, putative [Bodo saltans]|uniref:RING-type domain-containing protein n=1 Tax=Bodo saltans TaxID=75058 RepID=A0A0S4JK47_BODSA|nr:Hypothetical protein, putative [Bodo saltans]|eukprot:CUG90480.1 Hypothetical protein, putative [Bodo saltans]
MGPPPVVSGETFGPVPTFTPSTQSVPLRRTYRDALAPPPTSTIFHQHRSDTSLQYHGTLPPPPPPPPSAVEVAYAHRQMVLQQRHVHALALREWYGGVRGRFPAPHVPPPLTHVGNRFMLSPSVMRALSQRPSHTCNLCYEDFLNRSMLYTCDQKHNTCSRCLTEYILKNWQDNRRVSSGELRCCHTGCTSRPLTTQEVVRLVTSKAALEVYIDHTNRQTAAQCYAEAHAIVLKEAPQATAAADTFLQKQLQKSMHAARMCPHCQFGPIDFFGCDDLAQHHGEGRNGSRTKNSCPQCGYFSPVIHSWQRWDGVVRSFEGPVEQWSGEDGNIEYDDDEDEDQEYFDGGHYHAERFYSPMYGGGQW